MQGTPEPVERMVGAADIAKSGFHIACRLPAIDAGDETPRVGVRSGGSSTNPSVPAKLRKSPEPLADAAPPRAAPIIVFDGDREEIGDRGLERDRCGQRQAFGCHAAGSHGFGDRRNHVTQEADQGGDRVARQAENRLALGPMPNHIGLPGRWAMLWKTSCTPTA